MKSILRFLTACFLLIANYSLGQQVYLADNGITASGTGTSKKVSLGGTLTGNTNIPLGGFNLNFTNAGNIGIGLNAPLTPLHVYKNSSGNYNPVLTLEDGLGDGFVMFQMRGTNRRYNLGVGNGTWFNLQNDFFIWDDIAATARMVVSSTGNIGIGVNDPANRLSVAGPSAGTSGLQFTQLNSASTVTTGNGKVLSLDANGNVILVSDATGGAGSGWSLTGNSGTTGTDFIGTTDNNGLRFRTNNIEHMQLTADGSLLLGPSSSTYRFDVDGTAHFGSSVLLGSLAVAVGTNLASFSAAQQGIEVTDNPVSTIWFKTSPSPDIASNFVFDNITNSARSFNGIASVIRIAQGWGSPTNLSQAATLRIDGPINNTTGMSYLLRGIYYNPELTNTTNVTHIAYENTSGDNILNSASGNTIIGGGSSDGSKLRVNGTTTTTNLTATNTVATDILTANTITTNGFKLLPAGTETLNVMYSTASGDGFWGSAALKSWALGGNTGINSFGTTDNTSIPVITNNQLRMWIGNDGNIGVGNTTTPSEKLDVLGNIKATGLIIPTGAGAGKVLTSDANGVATWQTAGSGGGGGTTGWALTGNAGTTSANFIGTTDAADLKFRTDNTERVAILGTGNVGIGTSTPATKLHIHGALQVTSPAYSSSFTIEQSANGKVRFNHSTIGEILSAGPSNRIDFGGQEIMALLRGARFSNTITGYALETISGNVALNTTGGNTLIGTTTDNGNKLQVNGNMWTSGKMGIGTTLIDDPDYRLFVDGSIRARKLRVDIEDWTWPDYVFHQHYKLPSLAEVEQFIKKNSHLPGVPSAAEVKKTGLDVGDNQALLLKKIEELTLYIIDQNKKVEDQYKMIKTLEEEVQKLKKK